MASIWSSSTIMSNDLTKNEIVGSSEPVGSGEYEVGRTSIWGQIKGKAQVEVSKSRMGGGNWSNADLDPVLPEFQTWRTYNFITYWISDAFAVSNWRIGSSLIAIGLSWKLALVAVVIGNGITALVVTFNVRVENSSSFPPLTDSL